MLNQMSKRVIRNVTKTPNTSRRPNPSQARAAIHAWIDTGLRVIVNKPGDECHRQRGMVMATYEDAGDIDVLLDRGNFRTVHANCIIPEMVDA